MVKFCDKCGAELKDSANFCDKCGNRIISNNQTTKTTYLCPYCGQTIPYSTRCPYCGKSLTNDEDEALKCGLGVIGIFILLIFISAFAGFLLIIFSGA